MNDAIPAWGTAHPLDSKNTRPDRTDPPQGSCNIKQFVHEKQDGDSLRYALNPLAFEDVEAFTLVYSGLLDSSFAFGR